MAKKDNTSKSAPENSDAKNTKKAEVASALQEQLAEKLMGLFDAVISERKSYYQEHQDKIPSKDDANSIIAHYTKVNSGISGLSSLAPGPLGLLTAVPEIVFIIKNHLSMVYDIGTAYGKQKELSKELLAGIFLSALGTGGAVVLTVKAGEILVSRASLKVFQNIVQLIAVKVSQQLLKSMIGKLVPLIGAAVIAAWSGYTTRQIGKKAIAIFEKKIKYSPEELEEISIEPAEEEETEEEELNFAALKLHSLVNLLAVDGQVKTEEASYIEPLIEQSDLSEADKADLLKAFQSKTKFSVDYSSFAKVPEEAIGLMMDLVALSRRDGQFHISEKLYIKQVGKLLGFSETDIEEMLTIS